MKNTSFFHIQTNIVILILYNINGENMKQQIGLILIGSGTILLWMSQHQSLLLLQNIIELIQYQWPMILVLCGFCFVLPTKKKSKR